MLSKTPDGLTPGDKIQKACSQEMSSHLAIALTAKSSPVFSSRN